MLIKKENPMLLFILLPLLPIYCIGDAFKEKKSFGQISNVVMMILYIIALVFSIIPITSILFL